MSMKVILGHICVSLPLFQERSVVNLDRFHCVCIHTHTHTHVDFCDILPINITYNCFT